MSDLISRKEIIDRLERVIQNGVPSEDGMHPISAETVLEVVKGLSEHGTNLASLGTDCISRQQAIDALRTCYDTEMITMDNGDEYINYGDAVGEIKQLPTVQPKRGKWIKTARWGRVYYCNQCRNYLDFDGVNAGRGSTNFCPNCGSRNEVTT